MNFETLSVTITLTFIAVLILGIGIGFTLWNIDFAYGETLTIEGYDENREIFIANDGTNNIIILQSDTGISKHYDSKVKNYSSGGFSMKNAESGIVVFGHPTTNGKYKLIVLTSDQVYRFTGIPGMLAEIEEIPTETNSTKTNSTGIIYPKSSIGDDIAKYDIPTYNPRDTEQSFLMKLKTEELFRAYLNEEYIFNGRLSNVRTHEGLAGANVTVEIIRDDYVHKKQTVQAGKNGVISVEMNYLVYPLFYHGWCYDVKVTAQYGNNTQVWTDDLMVISKQGYWNPNTSWMGSNQYAHLPDNFREEPRSIEQSDRECNQ